MLMTKTTASSINGNSIFESLKDFKREKRPLKNHHIPLLEVTISVILFSVSFDKNLSLLLSINIRLYVTE